MRKKILELLDGYSYNAMEICRALNGLQPRQFRGCYYDFNLNGRHPRCRMRERGCNCRSNAVDQVFRSMEREGQLHSVKLRWFDGRNKGAAGNSLQLDVFRFYYRSKPDLAARLSHDIRVHLLEEVI